MFDTDLSRTTPDIDKLSDSIINRALQAKEARAKKSAHKKKTDEAIEATIQLLLEVPDGLTKGELLLSADSENLISVVLKIRNALKRSNLYTLKNRQKNKKTIYYLEDSDA